MEAPGAATPGVFFFCRITHAEIAVNGAYKAAILTKLNKNETKTLCIKSKITLSQANTLTNYTKQNIIFTELRLTKTK